MIMATIIKTDENPSEPTASPEKDDFKIENSDEGEFNDDNFQDIRDSHAASTKGFVCGICFKECSTTRRLNGHMSAHVGKPQKCPICSKEFPIGKVLTGHMLFHEAKAWKCTYCQNTFHDAKSLKSHMEEQHGHLKTNGVKL